MTTLAATVHGAASAVHTTPPSPAFYATLALYGIAALFSIGAFTQTPPRWVRVGGALSFALAFFAHAVDIGWRGVEGVHPGYSVREALGFSSWLLVGGYLIWAIRGRLTLLGAFVAPAAMVVLAAARLSPSGEALPGLTWLGRIHISLAALGVALFALATLVAGMYLLEQRNLKRKRFDRVLFRRGVALDSLDTLVYRLVLVGFPIFTASIVLGVVWMAQRGASFARIEYPLALIAWGTFASILVARARGWRGRRSAQLTILGFSVALVVFLIYLLRRAMGA
jgi:ABC-type uncharacterized transport system permease subunit